jgi:hypothetical protein
MIKTELTDLLRKIGQQEADGRLQHGSISGIYEVMLRPEWVGTALLGDKPTQIMRASLLSLPGIGEGADGKRRKLVALFEELPAEMLARAYDLRYDIVWPKEYEPSQAEEKKRRFINVILGFRDWDIVGFYDQSYDTLERLLKDTKLAKEFDGNFDPKKYEAKLRKVGWDRSIEIPIARKFLAKFSPETIVEIGAVMLYHDKEIKHRVVDPFDEWQECIREDGEKADIQGKNVLCIST